MDLPDNSFKAALSRGELQLGLWSSLCSNIAAEVVAYSGFDWILVDTEHSPNEPPAVLGQLQAMQAGTAAPIVRPAWNDPVLIKRLLDIGATGILVPFVQNAEEAARAVAACRYPPTGIRGITASGRASRYGRINGYLEKAGSEICVLVQIETAAALEQLEAIAQVDGVDGIFIGPSDLSASLGYIGKPGHPEVQAAIRSAAERLAALGKPGGILTSSEAEARRYIEWGFRFVAVGTDLGLLARGADTLVRSFKQSQPSASG
ncbi:HpcH/HpaI aldolase family protein [Aquamicrobium terrae]|uniref:4-hydroxy-2-oxoheptanedioate aldolase n=1 Tax=Aquamicrobium terrae TaxID=1324945 RepID=A0ABV2N7D6_9HYPH